MKRKNSAKGFTLIEVILVLAIAAMIFLMVLLTLPAVQRAQRDMQRKEDVGKVIAAYTEFLSNNRGTAPRDRADVCLGSSEPDENCDLDPYVRLSTDVTYTIQSNAAGWNLSEGSHDGGVPHASADNIAIYKQARCGTNGAVTKADSARQIAAVVQLEGAGANNSKIYYCQES